ncbi:MAG TPA: flippase activity-associated protein Agl23 [Candidatus Wujingus californicus]|uniref:flippase activity-associated protein Agl23 n=1 Tax=Candidatus Wujingus californicus TaxID=3367618 RepID=UPI001D9D3C46|nr:TIGR03663 family protein [Planctomycetota bacterium]
MYKQQKDRASLIIAFFVPVLIASLIRFWDLDLRPFHSDEGVNSHFLINLYKTGYYRYDPSNYHGPFLYYIGLIPTYILGFTDFSFRLLPVLFGIMTVALLYPLRKRFGAMGLLTAGLLVALSPSISFFSRDTIHEIYLIFFSLAIIVSFFLYSETRKSRYIYFAVASIAFVITIKETYIITFAIFALSLIIAYCFEVGLSPKGTRYARFKNIFTTFASECKRHRYAVGISVGMFFLINFLFYSSFFTYYEGVNGILRTLKIWSKTGMHTGGHAKPFIYYFKAVYRYEMPVLVLGIAGFFYAYRQRNKFTIFMAFWTILIYLIYSLVRYKTPWLIINILLPLSIMGGIFINGICGILKRKWHYAVFYPIYVCVIGFLCYQAIKLNFINYDDERCQLVYVQTKRDIYNLLDRLKSLSDVSGKDLDINIVSKEYWPLPWYFREYKNAHFWGRMIDNLSAPVIIVDKSGEDELKKKMKGDYKKERFILRPGVWLNVYMQKGLYEGVFGKESTSKTSAQPMAKVTRDELEPGLVGNFFHNVECAGKPFLTKVENGLISFTYNDETKKPYRSPFGIKWEGYLSITQKGMYKFATKSDDGSFVYIDGNMVVDNGDLHAMRYISGVVFLDEGFHHVRVEYFDAGGGAIMEFLWTPPGGSEAIVPANVLLHKRENSSQK